VGIAVDKSGLARPNSFHRRFVVPFLVSRSRILHRRKASPKRNRWFLKFITSASGRIVFSGAFGESKSGDKLWTKELSRLDAPHNNEPSLRLFQI
jgi:hypothetical protein